MSEKVALIVAATGVLVAAAAAFVSWGQLVTSKRKLGLDLFEKRVERYQSFLDARRAASADLKGFDRMDDLDRAVRDMHYLFGEDVLDMVDTIRCATRRLRGYELAEQTAFEKGNVSGIVHTVRDAKIELAELEKSLATLVELYIRMDQKLPADHKPYWPVFWLLTKSRARLCWILARFKGRQARDALKAALSRRQS